MKNDSKTNVQRIFEQKKIAYTKHVCENAEGLSGAEIAEKTGRNPAQVFKTLVTQGASKQYYVFVIPVAKELDLKKSAKVVGEKSIAMIKSKELLPLTGYIHGGCSPVGMKKFFRTTIDDSARNYETISFSAGKIGEQLELKVEDISKLFRYEFAELTCD